MQIAQRMKEIPFSRIRKIFETVNRLEAQGQDVIHLEIGRPDFDTPEHIKAAAKKALDEGQVHYGLLSGSLRVNPHDAQLLVDGLLEGFDVARHLHRNRHHRAFAL